MLSVFDSAHSEVRPLVLRDPNKVSMYVCGPTVYGPPHLGHGRFASVFDVVRRYLMWRGYDVTYVSNITDIEDKIIACANERGVDIDVVTSENEKIWFDVMDQIGVMRPDSVPHATQYVAEMVELISELIDSGAAYVASDGVYFRPHTVADYGKLARQDIDALRAGARVAVDDSKESPIDFVLWKLSKEGEPSWESPWGAGRPGWHTECVVMALDLLGEGFDIHGGGFDLRFPHHENERAQAVANNKTFCTHWMHNGFVEVQGEKMGKSLGNYTNMADLLDKQDPRVYRMLCLQAHYRSPIDVNNATTSAASAALERLDAFARRTADLGKNAEPTADALKRFTAHMNNDFATPAAMAVVSECVTSANRALDIDDLDEAEALVAAVREMLSAVGLLIGGKNHAITPLALELCRRRDTARADKDFEEADVLRNELQRLGFVVEDTASGTQIRAR